VPSFELHFVVEGLNCDEPPQIESVIDSLRGSGRENVRFDRHERLFSITLDPRIDSFADVRIAVQATGEKLGQRFLAVVMSL
jgi:hypothetical protein